MYDVDSAYCAVSKLKANGVSVWRWDSMIGGKLTLLEASRRNARRDLVLLRWKISLHLLERSCVDEKKQEVFGKI